MTKQFNNEFFYRQCNFWLVTNFAGLYVGDWVSLENVPGTILGIHITITGIYFHIKFEGEAISRLISSSKKVKYFNTNNALELKEIINQAWINDRKNYILYKNKKKLNFIWDPLRAINKEYKIPYLNTNQIAAFLRGFDNIPRENYSEDFYKLGKLFKERILIQDEKERTNSIS